MAAVHGAGSTARAASPASPTGDAALVCSLRGCGAPLKLVGKKRNRDRRPTYTCQRGHARKTCNECGKQVSAAPRSVVGQLCDTVTRRGRNCGIDSTVPHLPCLVLLRLTTRPVAAARFGSQGEAKNFSRHVCKKGGASRLALTRQPRARAQARPRVRARARPHLNSRASYESGSVGSAATFSSDSEDGSSVGKPPRSGYVTSPSLSVDSGTSVHVALASDRGGGSGGAGAGSSGPSGSTGGSDSYMAPISEDVSLPDDIDLSLLHGFMEGLDDVGTVNDDDPTVSSWGLPGKDEFNGLALWDAGVGSAAADLLMDASGSEGMPSPAVVGSALDMDGDLDFIIGELEDPGVDAHAAAVQVAVGGTAGCPAVQAGTTTVVSEPTSAEEQALVEQALLDSLVNSPVPAHAPRLSADNPGRRVRPRLAVEQQQSASVTLPTAPPTRLGAAGHGDVSVHIANARAATAAASAVAAAGRKASPTASTATVSHRGQPRGRDLEAGGTPAVPVADPRNAGLRVNVPFDPASKPASPFDWVRGRVSVFMGMFFLFYAVTFVLEAGIFGVDGINQSQASPAPPPAALDGRTQTYEPALGYGGVEQDVPMLPAAQRAREKVADEAEDEAMDMAGAVDGAMTTEGAVPDMGGAPPVQTSGASGAPPVMPAGAPAPTPKMEDSAKFSAEVAADAASGGAGAGRGGAPNTPERVVPLSAGGKAVAASSATDVQAASAESAAGIGVIAALAVSAVVACGATLVTVVVYRNRATLFQRCRRRDPLMPRHYDGGRLPMVRAV